MVFPTRAEAPAAREPATPERPPWPDLLHVAAKQTVDAEGLAKVLTFSFVAGDDAGVLATALASASIAPSSFDPSCFARDLFVEEFVRTCMRVHIGGRPIALDEPYLLRLLARPPAAADAVAQRREVWRELVDVPGARAALEAVYLKLSELRRLFEGEGRVGIRGEQARRRLDTLKAIEECFALMTAPVLAGASSVLRRIADYAAHVRASQPHARLTELLRYENESAFADLTLQLGADGTVRGLRVVRVREDAGNRYHVPLFAQWLGRFWLWLKGYRVSDGEIIDRWLDGVFEDVCPFLPPLLQLLGDLELYLAGLALRDACEARGLATCFAELVDGPQRAAVEGLFNPLLFALGVTPVPCALEYGPGGATTLITGPNSGGKTRLLQALGLLQLCAQAGMYAPAARAVLPRVPGIFASLAQPGGADQPEGRLGTELLRIRTLFERAEPGSLVLVDELCSGTSPSEGEELFRLVLELLGELAPTALVSTHFLQLAAALAREPGALALLFRQVELDRRQQPTYRFIEGVAETSLAKQTAARLGVTREELRLLMAQRRRSTEPRSERW